MLFKRLPSLKSFEEDLEACEKKKKCCKMPFEVL